MQENKILRSWMRSAKKIFSADNAEENPRGTCTLSEHMFTGFKE